MGVRKRGMCYMGLYNVVEYRTMWPAFVHHLFIDNTFSRLDFECSDVYLHEAF